LRRAAPNRDILTARRVGRGSGDPRGGVPYKPEGVPHFGRAANSIPCRLGLLLNQFSPAVFVLDPGGANHGEDDVSALAGRGDPRVVLAEAVAELINVAAVVDKLCDTSSPSMGLLEASRAIHHALVVLADVSGSPDTKALPARAAACT